MSSDQTRNVSRTAEMNAFIRARVACGQYQNASEVVRAGLRFLLQRAGPRELQTRLPPDATKTPRAAERGRHVRQV